MCWVIYPIETGAPSVSNRRAAIRGISEPLGIKRGFYLSIRGIIVSLETNVDINGLYSLAKKDSPEG